MALACLDGVIQTILYIAFAWYGLMGLALVVLGAVYWGESGAVSTTAIGLFALGPPTPLELPRRPPPPSPPYKTTHPKSREII